MVLPPPLPGTTVPCVCLPQHGPCACQAGRLTLLTGCDGCCLAPQQGLRPRAWTPRGVALPWQPSQARRRARSNAAGQAMARRLRPQSTPERGGAAVRHRPGRGPHQGDGQAAAEAGGAAGVGAGAAGGGHRCPGVQAGPGLQHGQGAPHGTAHVPAAGPARARAGVRTRRAVCLAGRAHTHAVRGAGTSPAEPAAGLPPSGWGSAEGVGLAVQRAPELSRESLRVKAPKRPKQVRRPPWQSAAAAAHSWPRGPPLGSSPPAQRCPRSSCALHAWQGQAPGQTSPRSTQTVPLACRAGAWWSSPAAVPRRRRAPTWPSPPGPSAASARASASTWTA